MAVFNNFSGKLRTMFDEGLDEVLILRSFLSLCCSREMSLAVVVIWDLYH